MSNKIIIYVVVFFFLSCKSQEKKSDIETNYSKIHPSSGFGMRYYKKSDDFLSSISEYWKNDSIGTNGFREAIIHDIIHLYLDSLVGKKWKDIEPYFGKSNIQLKSNPILIGYYSIPERIDPENFRMIIFFSISKKDSTLVWIERSSLWNNSKRE